MSLESGSKLSGDGSCTATEGRRCGMGGCVRVDVAQWERCFVALSRMDKLLHGPGSALVRVV